MPPEANPLNAKKRFAVLKKPVTARKNNNRRTNCQKRTDIGFDSFSRKLEHILSSFGCQTRLEDLDSKEETKITSYFSSETP